MRKAFASLVVDGRISGPQQECEINVHVSADGMSVSPDRPLTFRSDKAGMAWVQFRDKQGNYLSATRLGPVRPGQNARLSP